MAAAIRKPWHPPLGPRVGRAHAREKLCPQGLANLALPPWPSGHFFLAARRRSGRSLALLAVSLLALPALAQSTVRIQGCSDGATCRTAEGEIIRIACIDAAAFAGPQADRDALRRHVIVAPACCWPRRADPPNRARPLRPPYCRALPVALEYRRRDCR